MHYNDEDKLLIKTFTHAMRDIEHLYLQAIQSNNKELARKYAQQAQAIVEELKTHYQDWLLTSTADEYYAGFKEVEKMKRGVKQRKIRLGRDAIMLEVGTIHTDAMETLVNRSHRAVFSTLDGVKNNIIYGISMFNETKADMILQHQIQSRLGAGILTGKSVQTQKSELISFFKEKGFHLKDRNGRKRDPSTYAEMLIRTERARAYNTGTLNRGIELGITRYRVDESSNCCSICVKHNGKIVDITKGNYELPPYHPNCRGTIEPIWEAETPSKFGAEIDDKIEIMAKQAGITGKNTLDKMKQLNKFVKTSQGVKFRNTFYDIKDDVIIAEVRSKKKKIADKGEHTTYKIRQGKIDVTWHLGNSYDKFKKL